MRKFFLITLLVAVGLISCSKEESATIENDNQYDLIIEKSSSTIDASSESTTRNFDPTNISRISCINSSPCEPRSYTGIPDGMQWQQFHMYYDSSLTLAEVECVRYAYFRCFAGEIEWMDIQPTDPYHDVWLIDIAKPDNGLEATSNDDPRTGHCVGSGC